MPKSPFLSIRYAPLADPRSIFHKKGNSPFQQFGDVIYHARCLLNCNYIAAWLVNDMFVQRLFKGTCSSLGQIKLFRLQKIIFGCEKLSFNCFHTKRASEGIYISALSFKRMFFSRIVEGYFTFTCFLNLFFLS